MLLRLAGIPPRPYRPQDLVLILRTILWFGLNQLVEMATLIIGELVAGKASPRALAILLGDAATRDEIAGAPAAAWPSELAAVTTAAAGGSNAIAIAASRSGTGGALLAADPHMEIGRIPPVLYATHASHGDGQYMQGLHVPGVWVVSFGRTQDVAWTYTYGHVQSVDVHVVRCRRGEVFDGASWRPLARRDARVKIRRRAAETWTFWDSELGTVIGDAQRDAEIELPCIRWSGVRETYKDINVGLRLVRAKSVDEAVAAQREVGLYCLDSVFADRSGRIAHVLAGRMDARPAASGGVIPRRPDGTPAPANEATRPVTIDPASGWIVSANARPREAGGRQWAPMPEQSARYDRLAELVGGADRPQLTDLATFLLDACDASAARLLPIWEPQLPDHPRAKALVAWAGKQGGDDHFTQLSLWVSLREQVCRALLRELLGAERAGRLVDEALGLTVFGYHLDDALALLHPEQLDAAALRALLAEAFPRALAAPAPLPRRMRFKNAVFQGKLRWLLDSQPIENRGGPTTPNQVTAITIGGQDLVFGAAGRYLCDLSKPGGWYCISGGASERRFKIGYGAGLDDWSRGVFRPLGPATGAPPSSASHRRT